MKVIKSNNRSHFDVDNTLIMWPKDYDQKGPGRIEFNYGDGLVYLKPHKLQIAFLKQCFQRGDYMVVWSKHGWQWAEQICKKLKLQKYVDECGSKPTRFIDDKNTIGDVVGDWVYLPFTEEE